MDRSMRPVGHLKQKHVKVVAAAVQKLERENGKARPHDLLAIARPESSPLHSLFNWDNDDAAEKWRLHQARVFIRAVTVVYHEGEDEKWSGPAFVSVTTISEDEDGKEKRDRGYMSVERALSDPVVREQLLDEALRQADYWKQKYRNLKELQPAFTAIDEVKAKARGRQTASA